MRRELYFELTWEKIDLSLYYIQYQTLAMGTYNVSSCLLIMQHICCGYFSIINVWDSVTKVELNK